MSTLDPPPVADAEVVAAMARHPFVAGLHRHHLEAIAADATARTHLRGAYLFRHGGVADSLHLLVEGRVALEVVDPGHGTVVVETLGAGEPLGWSWLYPHRTWAFDARALEETRTLRVGADHLRTLIEEDAELGRDLALRIGRVVVDRLLHTRAQLVMASHDDRR